MSAFLRRMGDLFSELRRRHVFKVAGTYAVVALLVVQITSHVFPALLFPEWTQRLVVILALLGFPVALVLAWAFEMTPEGVRPTPGGTGGEASAAEGAGPARPGSGGGRPEGSRGSPEDAPAEEGSPVVSRAVAVGITAGLLTVVGFGLWTAGWDPTGAMEEEPPAPTAAADSAAAGEQANSAAVGEQANSAAVGEQADSAAVGAPGSAAPAKAATDEPAEPGAPVRASPGTGADGPESPRRGRQADPTGASDAPEAGDAPAPAPTSGVVVLVDGREQPGLRAVESVLLEELRSGGFEVADRTSMELRARAAGEPPPGELGRRAGAAVVVTAEYRAGASQQVRGFYTGTATLSVRAYETASGELLFSESFSVGGDSPGEMASTPEAAATKAAELVAYRAASALRRVLRDRS